MKLEEKLEALGYGRDYFEQSGYRHTTHGIEYLYELLSLDKIPFLEAMNIYANSLDGYGILLLANEDIYMDVPTIEEVFDQERNEERYGLSHFERLPSPSKEKVEQALHAQYEAGDLVDIFSQKATQYFFDTMQHAMQQSERPFAEGMPALGIIPAGHDIWGEHYSHLARDLDKELARTVHLVHTGKHYWNDALYEQGRLKVLLELDKQGYLNEEQQKVVCTAKEELQDK